MGVQLSSPSVVAGLLLLLQAIQPAKPAADSLVVGSPVERAIAAGESRAYVVPLAEGTFVQIAVDQMDIDLVATLLDPAGARIVSVNDEDDVERTERVRWIAESAGDYRLEIRPFDRDAAPGRFRARIETVRPALPDDRARVDGARAYADGQMARKQGTADGLRQGRAKFEEALTLFRSAGDRASEGDTVAVLGLVIRQLGESDRGFEMYKQSLVIRQEVGDKRGEAQSLHNIGAAYWARGEARQALTFYDQALPLRRAVGDRRGEGFTLHNLGAAYASLGEVTLAMQYYEQALSLRQRVRDRSGEAETLNNIAVAHLLVGEMQQAQDYLTRALSLARVAGDLRLESAALSNLAQVHATNGDLQRARSLSNQTLTLAERTANRRIELAVGIRLGWIDGLEGRHRDALAAAMRAVELARTLRDRVSESVALTDIAAAHRELGDPGKGVEHADQALRIAREIGSLEHEANALVEIGRSRRDLQQWPEATEALTAALLVDEALNNADSRAETLGSLASVQQASGDLDGARATLERVLDLIERQQQTLRRRDFRQSYLAFKQGHYSNYVELLMQLHRARPAAGFVRAAFEANERARARTLLDTLSDVRVNLRSGADPRLLERERELRRHVDAKADRLTRMLAGRAPDTAVGPARNELDTVLSELETVQGQLRDTSPRYTALVQPRPLSATEIQRDVLDEDTVLVEYSLGTVRSYVWVVTRTSITVHELGGRAAIEAAARRAHGLLTRSAETGVRTQAQLALRRLAAMIVDPIAPQLRGSRLLVVPDGALHFVPFASLPIPALLKAPTSNVGRPLLTRFEIVTMPSASVLAAVRRETRGRAPAPNRVAVLADPVLDRSDPRVRTAARMAPAQGAEAAPLETDVLRSARESGFPALSRLTFTRQEAQAIAGPGAATDVLTALDFEASRETALKPELASYRVVHFATHALINSEHPPLSGIVLSLVRPDGSSQDGLLRLHDIYNLRLNADLVVLSACQTALGTEVRGEGLVGLTRGFMYAGAPRVVASLWNVRDRATAELMQRFYARMRQGQRPAAALRSAQLSMLGEPRWSTPFHWAAFVFQGDWQ